MITSKKISIILCLLIVSFADIAAAMTVYMNDESEIEAQSAWKDGDRVYVRINPDLRLDFPVSDVNVRKSGIPNGPQERTPIVDKEATTPASARSGNVMDELIEVTGKRREYEDVFGRTGRGEIEQLLADTLTPALAEKTFRKCLERKLDNRELALVLAWYKSPVGQKILEAESVLDFTMQEKAPAYVGRDSVPGLKERKNLTAQIEKLTGASEVAIRFFQNLSRKIISAIPPDYPNAKEIKKRIQDTIHTLEVNRKNSIQNSAYTYRDLSINELRDYLRFLRSTPGKKYMAAARAADEDMLKKVGMNIEKEFRKYVRR